MRIKTGVAIAGAAQAAQHRESVFKGKIEIEDQGVVGRFAQIARAVAAVGERVHDVAVFNQAAAQERSQRCRRLRLSKFARMENLTPEAD